MKASAVLLIFFLTWIPSLPLSAAPSGEASGILDLIANGLLNPEIEPATRQSLLDEVRRRAENGDAWSAYLLGTFYRHGRRHPTHLVEQDFTQAERWLVEAAYRGQLLALPKLVELKTEQGELMTAMAWAQLYARLVAGNSRSRKSSLSTFSAWLIARLFMRMPDLDESAVRNAVNELLAAHGEKLEQGAARSSEVWRQPTTSEGLEMTKQASRFVPRIHGEGDSTMLEYAIAVDDKGRVTDVWLIDAVPDFDLGLQSGYVMKSARFNAGEPGQPRYAFWRAIYDNKHGLDLDGGRKFSIRRDRYPGFSR